MKNFVLIAISFLSFTTIIYNQIKAFQRGEYNPKMFRFRQGYEWKAPMILSHFGIFLPMYFLDSNILIYIYTTVMLLLATLSTITLNIKSINQDQKRMIIRDIIIMIIADILLITSFTRVIFF